MSSLILHAGGNAVELARVAWLDAKAKRSGSRKTLATYQSTLDSFRACLRAAGLDLDGDARAIALLAQQWAGAGDVAPATYNQRLAVVSSFYAYAHKQELLDGANPIDRLERRPVHAYAGAHALNYGDLKARLQGINRRTVQGARDYALLAVALQTGRRLSELAGLRWKDVRIHGSSVTLFWARTKGGKTHSDTLAQPTGRALMSYLEQAHWPRLLSLPADAPIWVSVSPRNRGQALSIQSIADICERHLGTSKVHALRHTFARAMEDSGAKVSDIQARLGHSSLATTGRYLAALKQSDNAHGDALADLFGIEG